MTKRAKPHPSVICNTIPYSVFSHGCGRRFIFDLNPSKPCLAHRIIGLFAAERESFDTPHVAK